MGLKKWWLWRHPERVRTFDEFVTRLKQEGCKEVICLPWEERSDGVNTMSVGFIGSFAYGGTFRSQALSNRWLVLSERYTTRWGAAGGFADSDEKMAAAVRAHYSLYLRWQELQRRLPGVNIKLVNGDDGSLITEEATRAMLRDVASHHLEPALPT